MLDQPVLVGDMRLFVRDVHTIAAGESYAEHYSCHDIEPSLFGQSYLARAGVAPT